MRGWCVHGDLLVDGVVFLSLAFPALSVSLV
jgi:hypothetical protein